MHAHTTLILDGGTGSFQMFVQAAGLGELSAALSAGEVAARRIEHRHTLAAPGAGEPVAQSAQIAG